MKGSKCRPSYHLAPFATMYLDFLAFDRNETYLVTVKYFLVADFTCFVLRMVFPVFRLVSSYNVLCVYIDSNWLTSLF